MKIVAISDTHGKHSRVTVPECDVLIHAGDLMYKSSIKNLRRFLNWFAKQPATHKIFIAGNHDTGFEESPTVFRCIVREYIEQDIKYLQDSEIVINGIRFYGSPWQPFYFNWAFNIMSPDKLKEIWSKIPNDTDVLITHGPPYGIFDKNQDRIYCGCAHLKNRVTSGELTQLKAHVFGHIHEQGGSYRRYQGVKYINASIVNRNLQIANRPISFTI